jgi:hypothetical protein
MEPRGKSSRWNRWIPAGLALILLCLAAFIALVNNEGDLGEPGKSVQNPPIAGSAELTSSTSTSSPAVAASERVQKHNRAGLSPRDEGLLENFRSWLEQYSQNQNAGSSVTEETLRRGEDLATKRRSLMLELIRNDPRAALRQAVSLAQWHALPPSIQEHVEEPFSEMGSYKVVPNCGNPERGTREDHLSFKDSTGLKNVSVFGRRKGVSTKTVMPAQGIRLGGDAALRENVFQPVRGQDLPVARRLYPVANPDARYCFASGRELGDEPVTALAGGKQFLFADAEVLRDFEARVARLDHRLTPKGSSAVIHDLAGYFKDAAGGFLLETAEATITELEAGWTLADKNVAYVRVTFSDDLTSPATKAELEANANGPVNQAVDNYSYGQVGITGSAHETIAGISFIMPHPSTYYEDKAVNDDFNEALDEIHADALSVSGINPDDYDVVSVVMPPLDLPEELEFTGLSTVNGHEQWLASGADDVMLHELGHNFGLRHSSRWDPEVGQAPVGAGKKEEYGDFVDNMSRGDVITGFWNQYHKSRLRWLGAMDWQDATTAGNGTYRVYRHDKGDAAGNQGVRVDKGSGPGHNEYYWLGYRERNRGVLEQNYFAEILWKQQDDNRSFLIDPGVDHVYPGNNDFYAANELGYAGVPLGYQGLPVGFTYVDDHAQVYITPVGIGEDGNGRYIDVVVNSGSGGGAGSMDVTLTGPTQNVVARSPAAYAASTNYGGTTAYGWSEGDDFTSGFQNTQTITWLTGGRKTVSVTASDLWGGSAKDTLATVTVEDPLEKNSWHTRHPGTTVNLWDIAVGKASTGPNAGSEIAIVVGRNEFGNTFQDTTLLSADGSNWSYFDLPNPNNDLFAAGYGDGLFVVAGHIYDFSVSSWVPIIYTSSDGQTWTERYRYTEASNFQIIWGISHNSTGWAVVGEEGNVFVSSDGISWSRLSHGALGLSSASDLNALNFRGAGAADTHHWISTRGGSDPGRTWISSNLTNWQEVTGSTPLDGNDYFDNSAFDGSSLFLGGLNVGLKKADSTLSNFSDPTIFLPDDDLSVGRISIDALVITNGVYLAIGEDYKEEYTRDEKPALTNEERMALNESDDVALELVSVDGNYWALLNRFDPDAVDGPLPDRRAAAVLNNTVITVSDGGSIRQSDPFYEPGGIWASWQQQFAVFLDNPPTSTSNQDGDPDPDLVEYALGNSPDDPSSSGGVELNIEGGNNTSTALEPGTAAATVEEQYPTLTVTRDGAKPDVTYTVTQATILDDGDINTAEFNTANTEIIEDTPTTLKVRSTTPISADPDQYLRLEVEITQ